MLDKADTLQAYNLISEDKINRKEFKIIADIISEIPSQMTKDEIANRFANALEQKFPAFDRNKFIVRATLTTEYFDYDKVHGIEK